MLKKRVFFDTNAIFPCVFSPSQLQIFDAHRRDNLVGVRDELDTSAQRFDLLILSNRYRRVRGDGAVDWRPGFRAWRWPVMRVLKHAAVAIACAASVALVSLVFFLCSAWLLSGASQALAAMSALGSGLIALVPAYIGLNQRRSGPLGFLPSPNTESKRAQQETPARAARPHG
jgi:hypothetical protein